MKLFLLITSLILFNPSDCDQMQLVRKGFHNLHTEKELGAFVLNLEEWNCEQAHPYLAAAIMQKAKYSFWPSDKFKYFKKGKNMLEFFINSHPEEIEARYVRLLVQSELPAFLNYKNNMESDAAFIKKQINLSSLPNLYRQTIIENVESIIKTIQ